MKVDQEKLFGPGESIGEGDSTIVYSRASSSDFLLDEDKEVPPSMTFQLRDFQALKAEVPWQKMQHAGGEVPRLLCAQGDIQHDDSKPVYRHPSDRSPGLQSMSPTVDAVRREIQNLIRHPVNHVLIQLYRSGQDFISEHSDKTLDVVHGSSIVNVSFGAQRTMRLRSKRPRPENRSTSADTTLRRTKQLVPMPHGSVFIMGPQTNARWLHGIMADKRRAGERSAAELAFGGERISLTFRWIGTFLDANERFIWGQGARGKSAEHAQEVVNGNEAETRALLLAFGRENQSVDIDWDGIYGAGSNVLHYCMPTRCTNVDDS